MIANNYVELLLVEDNPQDLELVQRCLRKANLADRIHVARDGAEALDFVFCDDPDCGLKNINHLKLIMLDLKMPKVGGFEVLSKLKSEPRTMMIPVVVMTSSQEQNDIVESFRLGANSFIVKPVGFEQFCETVQVVGTYWLLRNQIPNSAA